MTATPAPSTAATSRTPNSYTISSPPQRFPPLSHTSALQAAVAMARWNVCADGMHRQRAEQRCRYQASNDSGGRCVADSVSLPNESNDSAGYPKGASPVNPIARTHFGALLLRSRPASSRRLFNGNDCHHPLIRKLYVKDPEHFVGRVNDNMFATDAVASPK